MPRLRNGIPDHPAAKPPVPAPAAEALPVHVVHENAVYSREALRRALGLRTSSLRREIREKRLLVHKRCGKYFFIGGDVLAWLRGEAAGDRPAGPGRA